MIVVGLVALFVVMFAYDGLVYEKWRRRRKVVLIRAVCPDYPGAFGLTKQGEDDGHI